RRFCAECGAPLALACAACGFTNDAGEKFCGGCGMPLTAVPPAPEPQECPPQAYTPRYLAEKILTSKSALEGERKQVTVLFADLKGSMALLADRDPEEARQAASGCSHRAPDGGRASLRGHGEPGHG
ncbi:MAG TPA: zinc ribbon domain-containing protein, partial [Candidatus Tectomicrobia bacterium]